MASGLAWKKGIYPPTQNGDTRSLVRNCSCYLGYGLMWYTNPYWAGQKKGILFSPEFPKFIFFIMQKYFCQPILHFFCTYSWQLKKECVYLPHRFALTSCHNWRLQAKEQTKRRSKDVHIRVVTGFYVLRGLCKFSRWIDFELHPAGFGRIFRYIRGMSSLNCEDKMSITHTQRKRSCSIPNKKGPPPF